MLRVVRDIPTIPTTRIVLLSDPKPVLIENSMTGKDLHHIMIDLPPSSHEDQRVSDQPPCPVVGIVE